MEHILRCVNKVKGKNI